MPKSAMIGWIALAVLAALPAVARADAAADFARTEEALKANFDMQAQQSDPFDKKQSSHAGSDLYSLKTEHGQLVLRTTLHDSPGGRMYRVKIADQSAWSLITVQGGATDRSGPVVPNFFNLERMSFLKDRIDTVCLQQSGPMLMLSLAEQSANGGMRTIQLQEQFANSAAHFRGACQLVLMQMTPGHPWAPTVWNSDSFDALTLEHPAEVDRLLRPLLREVDQESSLTPDSMLAFELFNSQWPADASVAAKVNGLLAQLEGGDFHSRMQAQRDLMAMGKDAALVLSHLDRSRLAAEQNARIDAILSPYYPVPEAEAKKLRNSPGFLVNCLYSDDLIVRQSAYRQLLDVTKLPLKFDPSANLPARSKAIVIVRKEVDSAKPVDKK